MKIRNLDRHPVMQALSTALTDRFRLQPGQRVLIACSGGADSVALAIGMRRLADPLALQLGLAHLDHGLRGRESRRDAVFVEGLAEELALPVHTERVDLGSAADVEQRGRQARYAFFNKVCRRFGYPVVATGHQSDDNAEHVLMAVIRGSGPKGLSGIPPQREETDCRIIRPLLTVDRRQIISFLQAAKQPWVEDSSNRHLDFRRNRVRHRLLPMLQEEFNPAIAAGLNRLAGILRSEEQWIESIAGDHFQRCCQDRTDGRVTVDAAALECLPEAARRRVLRMAVAQSKGNLRRIALGHIDSLLALVRCGSGELHLPDRLHAVCRQGRLSLTVRSFALRQMPERRRDERPPQYRYQLEAAGRVHLPEAGRWLEAGSGEVPATETLRALPAMVACVDMDRAGFPLTVRSRLAGDRFQPLGMPAAQDLNRFMRSQKLTAMERAICPLVVSRGEIIWVGGCRIAEHAKIRSTTRRVLRLELSLAV